LGLQRAWWSYAHHGKRCSQELFKKGEVEFEKLNQDGAADVGHVYAKMLWSLYFIRSQGYEPECVGLYQDNISTQLLIKNGRFSSGKKTKHMKAKFFFIKDKVDSGETRVIDRPAEEMWADILTKPLHGMAFRTMRVQLMNCTTNYKDAEERKITKLMPVRSSKSVTWKDTKPKSLQTPQECVRLNRQKHLPRPRNGVML
jgi:hypothetical protein